MTSPGAPGGAYEVHNSTAIAEAFLELQREATDEGRGTELLQATRTVYERLRTDPTEFDEPLYRLPALCMQLRCVAVRPLYVDFAVCENRPPVFIKAVKLLASQGR
jgi:hypothetical protein